MVLHLLPAAARLKLVDDCKMTSLGLLFQAGIVLARYFNRVNFDPLMLSMASRHLPDSCNSHSSVLTVSFG